MSLAQFLRILWARRMTVVVATLSCLIAAVFFAFSLPPVYVAETRVLMDLVKPDPVTGQVMATQFARAYAETQTKLIGDYGVAGKAVDQSGWLADPALLAAYKASSRADEVDFRRWLAQDVMDRSEAYLIGGTNILGISYRSPSPKDAKKMAELLRQAYIDVSLQTRRETAAKTADWYQLQASKAKVVLDQAEGRKTAFERKHGIILQNDKTDLDSSRLQTLAGAPAIGASLPAVLGPTPSGLALANLDAQITQSVSMLGPNHPQMQEMRARRITLAAAAAQEQAAQRAANAAAAGGPAQIESAVRAQKSLVMSQRDKLEPLRQLQSEVDLRRDQYNKLIARMAELRQEAQISEAGLTPMGIALEPDTPVSPNRPVIIIGALGFGLVLGLLVALLSELLGRRVRGAEDLRFGTDLPVLAVIASVPANENAPGRRRLGGGGQRQIGNRWAQA
jgi:polysaccharide biosynthesis transport protein